MRIAAASVVFVLLAGCGRVVLAPESYLPDENSLGFDVEPLPKQDGMPGRWIAGYKSQGKVSTFLIELGSDGEGRLIPVAGSDSTVLLVDLGKAMHAKTVPQPVLKKTSVRFVYANLGDGLSQASGGGLNAEPRGNWTALKLFFGEGEQESQVFLNVNARIKKGQFSMKDEDYGDLLLAELAKVL